MATETAAQKRAREAQEAFEVSLLEATAEAEKKAESSYNGPTVPQLFFLNRLLLQRAGMPERLWEKGSKLSKADASGLITVLKAELIPEDEPQVAATA